MNADRNAPILSLVGPERLPGGWTVHARAAWGDERGQRYREGKSAEIASLACTPVVDY